jgi:hypothetical protein
MRTAIKAGWIVGYDNGGHTLIRNGAVVFEGNRIISEPQAQAVRDSPEHPKSLD